MTLQELHEAVKAALDSGINPDTEVMVEVTPDDIGFSAPLRRAELAHYDPDEEQIIYPGVELDEEDRAFAEEMGIEVNSDESADNLRSVFGLFG